MPDNITQIPAPRVDLIEPNTGVISRQWFRYFNNLNTLVGGGLGVIPVSSGGTGLSTIPTNGQLLIGNGTGYTLNTLAVNNGISVVNGLGTITLNNTGVLSFSGGTTGLTPVTATTGNVTLAGTLAIANGGTNTSIAPSAYGVVFGNSGGTAYTSLTNGTTGQILSATTGGAPIWSSAYNGTVGATTPATGAFTALSYNTTLTGGTGIIAVGTNQFYKDASGNVGLGTTVPDSRLTINKNSAAPAAIVGTPYLNIVGANSETPRISFDSYNGINVIVFRRANGTQAAPSALLSGEQMGNISVFGYGATGYTTTQRGFITFNADENWTDAAQGSRIIFATTSAGTAAAGTERMRIDSNGNVGVGTSSPSATAILDAQSTTKGVRFPNMTTAQKNAIAAPAAGLVVFDTTLAKLCVYSGAAWQTITSI